MKTKWQKKKKKNESKKKENCRCDKKVYVLFIAKQPKPFTGHIEPYNVM